MKWSCPVIGAKFVDRFAIKKIESMQRRRLFSASSSTPYFFLVIEFSFQEAAPSYFIEMKSQVAKFDLVQVIKLVISHNDNLMAVMRFALDRTKARKAAEFFK